MDWIDMIHNRDGLWLLWIRHWTFAFENIWGISWLPVDPLTSQEVSKLLTALKRYFYYFYVLNCSLTAKENVYSFV